MHYFKQVFDRRNKAGTTFGAITKGDLFSLEVVKPQKEIIEIHHNITNLMFEKQNTIEYENLKLAELRNWLLPMLMNGQVTVGEGEEKALDIMTDPGSF